jgi:hypothetical protein
MTVTSTALFRGSATTNTDTTLFTVGSNTTAVVTNIAVTNSASTDATFTLKLDGIDLLKDATIAKNSVAVFDLKQVLNATKIIAGGASATTVRFHISGVVIA